MFGHHMQLYMTWLSQLNLFKDMAFVETSWLSRKQIVNVSFSLRLICCAANKCRDKMLKKQL